MWGHMTHDDFFGGHFGFYEKCSFWPETPFGEVTRQFQWNFLFPSTFGGHFDQEILIWGYQNINQQLFGGPRTIIISEKQDKNFRGRPFWILRKMLLFTWNIFSWRDEAISMKFFVSEHLWWPFWPGNIDLRVPIYQQKLFGGPISIIMSEKQKKNSEGGHFGFYEKCSFWPETPFGEVTRQFWRNFSFPSTFGSHFDQEILIWGCQYINKKCLGDQDLSLWVKNRKKISEGSHFGFYEKCSFSPETPFGEETRLFQWNVLVSEHLWRPFWPQNIDLRVPIYQ